MISGTRKTNSEITCSTDKHTKIDYADIICRFSSSNLTKPSLFINYIHIVSNSVCENSDYNLTTLFKNFSAASQHRNHPSMKTGSRTPLRHAKCTLATNRDSREEICDQDANP